MHPVAAERFGARLKELREQAGLTQQELADRVETTVRTISRLETGVQEPTWTAVVALADALGVDCRAFLQEPACVPEPKRGRPKKAGRQSPGGPASKRPRGHARK